MKIAVYNRGGFNSSRHAGRWGGEDFIINMDQTPVYHAMNARSTIEHVGVRTVNMRMSTGNSKCVTVAATITASGKIVPTMVVFKGESSNDNSIN
jgi:hypothetical protein